MYLNYGEIVTLCELLAEQFPDEVSLEILPEPSLEGRPIPMLRIRSGTETRRHGLYIQANIHGNEWGTADTALHFVQELLAKFHGSGDSLFGIPGLGGFGNSAAPDPEVRTALERVELFVVPCVNPDGRVRSMLEADPPDEYAYSLTGRKNRRDNGDGTVGVDLNRNCDWIWDFATAIHPEAQQSTGNHCRGCVLASDLGLDPTFHGTAPFSEPEARNVRAVLDANPHIRAFVDLHGFLGKIMTPWADDELQAGDPDQSFANPAYDGLRGLRDEPLADATCADTTLSPSLALHADGPRYREFMPRYDQKRYGLFATLQHDAVRRVRGRRYQTGISFNEMYGMSGNMHDYAYSRHLAQPECGKIDGYIYEFESVDGFGFHPPFEDPPGPSDMIHTIRDLAAGLTALLHNVDRIPIVAVAPHSLDFGRVPVGTAVTRSFRLSNGGVRPLRIVGVELLGPAGPYSVGAPSATALPPQFSAGVEVTVVPTAPGRAIARVAIEFEHVQDEVPDVRIVPCVVEGCTLPAGACAAPMFKAASALRCFVRAIVYGALIAALALPALFSADARCTIRQLVFRIAHCRAGNRDGCREL